MVDFRLVLVTDRRVCRSRSLENAVETACRAGVRAVQLREKDLTSRALFALASDVRRVTSAQRARLFINDRVDLALAVGADGVHCPERGFPPDEARRLLGAPSIVGASCHSLESAVRARRAGADFVFFGPVFPTPSKIAYGDPVGLEALREVSTKVDIPVFAIGGITPPRSAQCRDHGAAGVAVISALMAATDVSTTVGAFEKALGEL